MNTIAPSSPNPSTTPIMDAKLQILQADDAKPSWTYRRQIVRLSLIFIGILFTILVLTTCVGLLCGIFNKTVSVSQPLADTIDNALYVLGFVYTTIVGSYMFGVNTDMSKYRVFLVESSKLFHTDAKE